METPVLFEIIIATTLTAAALFLISIQKPVIPLIMTITVFVAGPQYYLSFLATARPALFAIAFLAITLGFLFFYRRQFFTLVGDPTALFLISFIFLAWLSSMASGVYYNNSIKQLMYILIVFLSVLAFVTDWEKLHTVLKTLIFCGLLIAFFGIMNFISPGFLGMRVREGLYHGQELFRTNVEGLDPNGLAAMLMMIAPVPYYYYATSQNKGKRWLYLGILTILILATTLTVSRTGFVLIVLFIVLTTLRNFQWKSIVGVFSILAIILIVVPPVYWARIGSIHQDPSGNGRLIIWRIAQDMFMDNPWLGVGYGNFAAVIGKYTDIYVLRNAVAHNIYVELLAETGIFIFFFFLLLLVRVFYDTWKVKRSTSSRNYPVLLLMRIVQTGILLFMVQGFFLSTLETMLFFVYMGIAATVRRNLSEFEKSAPEIEASFKEIKSELASEYAK